MSSSKQYSEKYTGRITDQRYIWYRQDI